MFERFVQQHGERAGNAAHKALVLGLVGLTAYSFSFVGFGLTEIFTKAYKFNQLKKRRLADEAAAAAAAAAAATPPPAAS